ncbi:MAG: trypsin-like peptidase domain-containing protein [Clostridium sp.]|nr:trypsin-like peptidase domain-containing protein [Clostridium sp.]MCM1208830.1 trypsin-like peptidase domain-containing protein [Ruminococcus sp.]
MSKGKTGFLKRTAALVLGAVLFGAVAGVTFNYVADTDNGRYFSLFQEMGRAFEVDDSENGYIEKNESDINSDEDKKDDFSIPTTSLSNSSSYGSMDVSDIVEAVMPSVVSINVTAVSEYNFWYYGTQEYESEGSGSGIIIGKNDTELLIVTNNHVVEDAKTVNVCFVDEQSYDAVVKGTDSDNDVAIVVVKLEDLSKDTLSKIEIAKLGNSDEISVGEQVVAIGNALGYGQSVTTGIVSAKDRIVSTNTTPLIQTDAAINPGNSGGALLNMKGEVIGINSSKYMSTEVEGMGYAIPVSKIESILDNLMNRKTRELVEDENERGYLGITCSTAGSSTSQYYNIYGSMEEAYDTPTGVYVNEVTKGSPAYKAGLKEGNIITAFDGQSVSKADDLTSLLQHYEAGETVELTILVEKDNEYQERTIKVRLGSRADLVEH